MSVLNKSGPRSELNYKANYMGERNNEATYFFVFSYDKEKEYSYSYLFKKLLNTKKSTRFFFCMTGLSRFFDYFFLACKRVSTHALTLLK